MTEPNTRTLEVPGGMLAYDVRDATSEPEPVLLMTGSPMGAAGFGTLAGHFRDRVVVTCDPLGVGRSQRDDGATWSTPDEHAEALRRLIDDLDAGPVDVFASSGGAVNALELIARHPEQVRVLVAHEPPLATVLADRDAALAAIEDVHETYDRDGLASAMAKFIALTSLTGPIPADFADHAAAPASPEPRPEDDGSRDNPMLGPHIIHVTHHDLDFDSLRDASTRLVIAAGIESEATFTHRVAVAAAKRLGTEAVIFPSHHGGFLGGEFGQHGDPDAFAATLRDVLTDVR